MEFYKYIQLLKRRRWLLLGIPLFSVALTWLLLRKMPDSYTSKTTLATGLVDQSQQVNLGGDEQQSQESRINQQFSNLLQILQLKKVLDRVSMQLMLHDLTHDSNLGPQSKLLSQLNEGARKHAADVLEVLYASKQSLQPDDPDHRGLNRLLESMGYDEGSLRKKLQVYRVSTSDYIDIEFESATAELSAVAANTIASEFVAYYTEMIKQGHAQAVNFLDSILSQKKSAMDKQMLLLKHYKINNRVLNLNEQAKSLYGQLADFEQKKEIAKKDIEAYTGALKSIDEKFTPKERGYLESTLTSVNRDIVITKEFLQKADADYYAHNFEPHYKERVDSLKKLLTFQVNQSNDHYLQNPLAVKQDLIKQKIGLEVELEVARNSLGSLDKELGSLNRKFDRLVPHEAVIQTYEESIDFASKEYIEILKKYNQTSLESNIAVHLRQIEKALPGAKQSSKKIMLVALAGLVALILCLVALFICFYVDSSVGTMLELANATGLGVLGYLPLAKTDRLDLSGCENPKDRHALHFVHALDDTRFEISHALGAAKSLLVTSMSPGEGKTVFALGLAQRFAATGKKVVLIDGNAMHPGITEIAGQPALIEDFLSGKIEAKDLLSFNPAVLGVRSSAGSLLELAPGNVVAEKMHNLQQCFDLVITEAPALMYGNKAKEWFSFHDKLLAVFEAGQTIGRDKRHLLEYLKAQPNIVGWVITKTKLEKTGLP